MGKAFEYLNMLPGDTAEEVLQLRDRIFNAGAPDLPVGTPQPPFPYEAEVPQPDASVSGEACMVPTAAIHLSSRGLTAWRCTVREGPYPTTIFKA